MELKGSSATLVNDELLRKLPVLAIYFWSYLDLFLILFLQTFSPK
jgi:hypothetical protein